MTTKAYLSLEDALDNAHGEIDALNEQLTAANDRIEALRTALELIERASRALISYSDLQTLAENALEKDGQRIQARPAKGGRK